MFDVACGTGQLVLELAEGFRESWALDQEPEMIEVASRRARERGVSVRWAVGAVESFCGPRGYFELVTIGSAFQRLERQAVAHRVREWLRDDGHLALVWSQGAWHGDSDWQRCLEERIDYWGERTNVDERVPPAWASNIEETPHATILKRAGLECLDEHFFPAEHDWDVDGLIGLLLSTSFMSREALGDLVEEFKRDLREALLACRPDNRFHEVTSFSYQLARPFPESH